MDYRILWYQMNTKLSWFSFKSKNERMELGWLDFLGFLQ